MYYFIITILKLNQIEVLGNNYFYDVMNPWNADVMYTENNVWPCFEWLLLLCLQLFCWKRKFLFIYLCSGLDKPKVKRIHVNSSGKSWPGQKQEAQTLSLNITLNMGRPNVRSSNTHVRFKSLVLYNWILEVGFGKIY